MSGLASTSATGAPATGVAETSAADAALEQAVQDLLHALEPRTSGGREPAGAIGSSRPNVGPAPAPPAPPVTGGQPNPSAPAPSSIASPVPLRADLPNATLEGAASAVLRALSRGDTDGARCPA